MRTLIESGKELPQFEAVALIDEERRPEPGLVREEPENGEAEKSFCLEEAPARSNHLAPGPINRCRD